MGPNQTYKLLYLKGNPEGKKKNGIKYLQSMWPTRTYLQNKQTAHTTKSNNKINSLIDKWEEDTNRHFCKEDMRMANRY